MYHYYVTVVNVLLFYHVTVIVKMYKTWNINDKGNNGTRVKEM